MTYLWIAIFSYLSGLVKGTTGFGSSLVAIPLLTIFFDIQEVVFYMITYNVILNSMLVLEHRDFAVSNVKKIWPITLFGILFTLVGFYLLINLEGSYIKYIAAFFILFAVYNNLTKKPIQLKDTMINKSITGVFSGLGNGIASIDGPPVVFYLSGIGASKAKFKSTLASHFLILGLFSVVTIVFFATKAEHFYLHLLFIGSFAILGAYSGIMLSRKLNEEIFKKVVSIILILLALNMIVSTLI